MAIDQAWVQQNILGGPPAALINQNLPQLTGGQRVMLNPANPQEGASNNPVWMATGGNLFNQYGGQQFGNINDTYQSDEITQPLYGRAGSNSGEGMDPVAPFSQLTDPAWDAWGYASKFGPMGTAPQEALDYFRDIKGAYIGMLDKPGHQGGGLSPLFSGEGSLFGNPAGALMLGMLTMGGSGALNAANAGSAGGMGASGAAEMASGGLSSGALEAYGAGTTLAGMGSPSWTSGYDLGEMGGMAAPATAGMPSFSGAQASLSPGVGNPYSPWETLSNAAGSLFSGNSGGILGNIATSAGYPGLAGPLNAASSIGSGIYGLYQQEQLRKKAAEAAKLADPWGMSGGRGVADAQLQQLLRDPTAAMATDPGFAARIQAAQRATGKYGQGSGAMAVAGAKAGGDWYSQRLAEMGGLAGAGFNPASGAQIGLQGNIAANDLASQSLASIGFGLNGAAGGSGMNPQLMQALQMVLAGRR